MTNDLVSDMLTRIRNASMAHHSFTYITYSNLSLGIVKVLLKDSYINDYYIEEGLNSQKRIKVILKYKGWWIKKPLFSKIKRISRPGQRIFSGYRQFKNKIDALKYEQGIAIISTSSGVMNHLKATKLKKGGEILCYIG